MLRGAPLASAGVSPEFIRRKRSAGRPWAEGVVPHGNSDYFFPLVEGKALVGVAAGSALEAVAELACVRERMSSIFFLSRSRAELGVPTTWRPIAEGAPPTGFTLPIDSTSTCRMLNENPTLRKGAVAWSQAA